MEVKDTIIKTEKIAFGQVKLNYKIIFTIFKAAFLIVRNPRYWKYIFLSILVNFLVLIVVGIIFALLSVGLTSGAISLLDNYNSMDNAILEAIVQYDQIAYFTFGIIFFVVGLFVGIVLFNSIASIVNAPIYDALTERTLNEYHIEEIQNYHGKFEDVYNLWTSLGFEMKKIILSIIFFLISSLLNLIPVVGNGLFVFLNFINLVITSGIGTFDPALSRSHTKFRTKIYFVVENPAVWPFVIVSGIINAIPIVNFLTIPLTIVASTMIYVEVLNQQISEE